MKSLRELYTVGRGPSSSHTIGPTRACCLFREEHPDADRYEVALFGSLALTGRGHLTDVAVRDALAPVHTDILWNTERTDLPHPNTMELRAYKNGALTGEMTALSVGGGAISIPGTRCSGIFTAGAAQRYVNIEGYMPGKRIVILGSGDIGLIMARRMTLEGAKVLACVELMPYSSGLNRNIVQCLHDFDIPLYLSHTVTDIQGKDRLERVVVSKVGADRRPIPGTEMVFDCDTLLLSVGLIPENELTRRAGIEMDRRTSGPSVFENMETSLPGVFACGNVVHVHDLVDFVTAEAEKAGRSAAGYVLHGAAADGRIFATACGACVTYTVPQHIRLSAMEDRTEVSFRVNRSFAKSRVLVTDETGAVIAKFARQHMAPGEMEHVALPRVLLEKAAGQTLTLACEEVSE